MLTHWPCPQSSGKILEEMLAKFDHPGRPCVLVIPPLFDEHNKFRRQIIEIMRLLDDLEIGSAMPDLPGWNESTALLAQQSVGVWQAAMGAAASHCEATHVLTFRAGVIFAPPSLPGWAYAPQTGAKQLRSMIRAQVIAAREAGADESSDTLMQSARESGMVLAGWDLGAQLVRELEQADEVSLGSLTEITQSELGGRGLWLRAEPDEDPEQAAALATLVAEELVAP